MPKPKIEPTREPRRSKGQINSAGQGNGGAIIPGQIEANFAKHTAAAGLLFTKAEVDAFNEIAREYGQPELNVSPLKTVTD